MIEGILPPVPTPFTAKGDVNLDAMAGNISRWVGTRLSGIVVLGSNGEAPYVDEDESERVVATARAVVPRDRVLVAGTGRESTRAAIVACERAAHAGADMVLVRTPSFFRTHLGSTPLIRHFTAVADRCPVPVLLYNFAAFTGVNLAPAAVATLSGHPNIAGIKESGGDIGQVADYVNLTPDSFRVVVGSAPTLLPSLLVGACGGIVALACVVPDLCVELYDHAEAGRFDEARRLQRALTPLARAVTTEHGIAGLKAAVEFGGHVGGNPRSPLLPISPEARESIRRLWSALVDRPPA